jgi:hypothetical protein
MVISPYPILPFLFLFVIISVVAVACLIKFPSLRNYRKKQNVIVYSIVILLLGLIAFQVYDWSLGSPIITNRVSLTNNKFQAGQMIALSITSENLCNRELTFDLTVSCVNASLSPGDLGRFIQVDNSTVKIPFHFNAGSVNDQKAETILFTINKDSPSFRINFDSPITTTGGQCTVEGSWDATTSSYSVWAVQAPAIM